MQIKHMVANNTVRFVKYRQGLAYYAVRTALQDGEYLFPVPLADVGDATLLAEDKAILFMRYIRQAMENGSFVQHGALAESA